MRFMLRQIFEVAHSLEISQSKAVTRRRSEASLGKREATRVRRLTRISHTRSTATGCGQPLLRSGPNCPWAGCSHPVRREPPFGKSGPHVDALGTLRATLRVVCLRLPSLRSVDLRFASIRFGCKSRSSRRLVTKGYEKCSLSSRLTLSIALLVPGRRRWGSGRLNAEKPSGRFCSIHAASFGAVFS
jgi:hypothetical protein